jgi:hypothetical protein
MIIVDDLSIVRDPSGNPIENASVTLQVFVDGLWQSIAQGGQINPLATNTRGLYGWIVAPGTYRILAEKDGYISFTSDSIRVEHAGVFGEDITLHPTQLPQPHSTIVDQIKTFIASPITRSLEILESLQTNGTVHSITRFVVAPTATIAATLSGISLIAQLGFTFRDIPALLLQLVYLLLELLGIRKKRKPWGAIIDTATNKSIPLAKAILLDAVSNQIIEIAISAQNGTYGFLRRRGDFRIIASKKGFSFPPLQHPEAYRGTHFVVSSDEIPQMMIYMDPVRIYRSETPWQRLWLHVEKIMLALSWSILIIGLMLSLWSYLIQTSLLSLLLVGVYIILLALKYILITKTHKNVTLQTHKGISYVNLSR